MPLQNRVRPDGEIVAIAARGTMMGNRGGRLHDGARRLGRRRWAGKAWICCVLDFRGRRRPVMGDSYTELFFLDEATALAAGHRPCFECRHADAVRFATLWNAVRGRPGRAVAAEMDAVLHKERRASATAPCLSASLPDGAIVSDEPGAFALCLDRRLLRWSPEGYRFSSPMPPATATIVTPPAILAILSAGYRPKLHASAMRAEGG